MSNLNVGKLTSSSGVRLPLVTAGTRPTGEAGLLVYNSTTKKIELYDGTSWREVFSAEEIGTTANTPAADARQIYAANPSATNGLYYISTANGGVKQVYCDFTTPDENGDRGWMLVASWASGSQWRDSWTTSSATLSSITANTWSSNFGNNYINKFRITATNSISSLGSSAAADWYYHYTVPVSWKSVWAWGPGSSNWINDTTGDGRGNINFFSGWPSPVNNGTSTPRCCLRGFNWAYNIKYNYQASTQRWNNLSDSGGGGTGQAIPDFWAGLTTPGITLNYSFAQDATLGIIPQGDTSTTCAHDCNNNNAKVGQDDSGICYYYGSSSTANLAANVGNTGTDYPLLFWIK